MILRVRQANGVTREQILSDHYQFTDIVQLIDMAVGEDADLSFQIKHQLQPLVVRLAETDAIALVEAR